MTRRVHNVEVTYTLLSSNRLDAAFGNDGDVLTRGRVGDQAEEPHRVAARVAELVDVVGGDEHDVAGGERAFLVAVDDDAAAGEHVHFVLVIVEVFGRVAAGRDFELRIAKFGALSFRRRANGRGSRSAPSIVTSLAGTSVSLFRRMLVSFFDRITGLAGFTG